MKKLVIKGKRKLTGEIRVSGAKNAALPLLASSLLIDGELTLFNLPNVTDISSMSHLLLTLGAKVEMDCNLSNQNGNGKVVGFSAKNLKKFTAPYSIVRKMRASFFVMGPLLGRLGKAKVSLPGGCAIGTRPVDIHLDAFRKMGAEIETKDGYIHANAKGGRLKGTNIRFRFPSVGATENVMMAATLAKGTTVLNNAAKEPEIVDLAKCLNSAGAQITGAGTEKITIKGVDKLNSTTHTIIGDRIEAATYIIAAAMTDGDLIVKGIDVFEHLGIVVEKLKEVGVSIEPIGEKVARVKRSDSGLKPVAITTSVFPGFPTDIQAQMMALLSMIDGESMVDETIFENRFMHVPELNRMGADIYLQSNKALIKGKRNCLRNAEVMATDLRASVSLALAGLCAEGRSVVHRIYHLERGYEFLADKLRKCNADVEIIWDSKDK